MTLSNSFSSRLAHDRETAHVVINEHGPPIVARHNRCRFDTELISAWFIEETDRDRIHMDACAFKASFVIYPARIVTDATSSLEICRRRGFHRAVRPQAVQRRGGSATLPTLVATESVNCGHRRISGGVNPLLPISKAEVCLSGHARNAGLGDWC